ncbi:MAG: MBL fold metallo-hydrolase, partial [Parvibaculum sp.]
MTLTKTSPSRGKDSAEVTGFYDEPTGSIQYLVSDPQTGRGAVIDAVMGFDPAHAVTDTEVADAILDHADKAGITIDWIL